MSPSQVEDAVVLRRARIRSPFLTRLARSVRCTWAVCLRELLSLFFSPVAYVVIFLFVFSHGWVFWQYCKSYEDNPQQIPLVVRALFSFALYWTVLISPLLTMRSFAEERRSGTIEMLMTAPVTATQVVLGKFVAAQVFYTLIWATLLLFLAVLEILGNPDWGPIVACYIGLFFLGTLTNSLGILASALTRNQLVAAVLAISGVLFVGGLGLLGAVFAQSLELQRLFHFLSYMQHFSSEYIRGIVDLRFLGLYLGCAVFFLFLSVHVVEDRKWR